MQINNSKRYDRPIKIAEGIYWVGFYEERTNLHCNPYLIVQDDKAVLIDSGSRPDFAVVMMKVLQTGLDPKQIIALIYHHYDPDLCGSMPNMIDICENPSLKVLSEQNNNIFINYYIEKERHHLLESIDVLGNQFIFNGRKLQFLKTPYSHCPGSFVTYDIKTKTLFSSDLFGSFSTKWDLFTKLDNECMICVDYNNCINRKIYCPLPDIIDFHRQIMPSEKSLHYAMNVIKNLDINIIAPQHGSIFVNKRDIYFIIEKLGSIDKIGIDSIPFL